MQCFGATFTAIVVLATAWLTHRLIKWPTVTKRLATVRERRLPLVRTKPGESP